MPQQQPPHGDIPWRLDIITSGRGGVILYTHGDNCVRFDWEFAMPPAIALVFGPSALAWNQKGSWAAGRRAEIFDAVGQEIVRQQAPQGECIVDLDTGMIEILRRKRGASDVRLTSGATTTEALTPIDTSRARGTIAAASPDHQSIEHRLPLVANEKTMEALALIDTPEARAAIDAASQDHLSIETRLAAAEVMHRQQRLADLDAFLARQIRKLHRVDDGLERALRLAAAFPSDTVKQALLYASCNATPCAPRCAAALLSLSGVAQEPFNDQLTQMLHKLDRNNSQFDRAAAFEQLCSHVSMTLDEQ